MKSELEKISSPYSDFQSQNLSIMTLHQFADSETLMRKHSPFITPDTHSDQKKITSRNRNQRCLFSICAISPCVRSTFGPRSLRLTENDWRAELWRNCRQKNHAKMIDQPMSANEVNDLSCLPMLIIRHGQYRDTCIDDTYRAILLYRYRYRFSSAQMHRGSVSI